jgi:hypothetical protein
MEEISVVPPVTILNAQTNLSQCNNRTSSMNTNQPANKRAHMWQLRMQQPSRTVHHWGTLMFPVACGLISKHNDIINTADLATMQLWNAILSQFSTPFDDQQRVCKLKLSCNAYAKEHATAVTIEYSWFWQVALTTRKRLCIAAASTLS